MTPRISTRKVSLVQVEGSSRSSSGTGPGGSGPGPSSCGVHARSGGGEQGHVEEDRAASPKKRRLRAG
ncbi:hypothetical protein CHLRE_01g038376v5 [Chlamydomonas reinhardtii]|uniref:Uncharacterized protein n=1 Tax=Chlamydomonas reinhardtii TaxID=3055 RepID=A0A2K3E773_CHLRE|nr:uncharacterized protein CHLRE_01g038376v5 [Chlamydomonas reinhardtii]PNW88642.1 hypothetical protein CHLRE_01g038376v5 [Chlamydomonas reinhardtii]